MIEKLTPDQLKAVFDLSDTSDVTEWERMIAVDVVDAFCNTATIRLLKHCHPELFVDPRLEAAKKLAREILAEEFFKAKWEASAKKTKAGENDHNPYSIAVTRALLMDPPTVEGNDA